ncbi:MAG: type II toxin-antitoxin system HicB family antitoxin [Limosilactobacillus pontis]
MKKERLVAYPAVLDDRDNEKGFYTVTFPDVPAAISQGKGIAEAIINGASALGLVLYDATPLPERSDIDVIKKNNKGTVVTYIAVDLNEAKKNVTLPVVKKIQRCLVTWRKSRSRWHQLLTNAQRSAGKETE